MDALKLRQQLAQGPVWITARGQSMQPLWGDGARLLVQPIAQPLRCGDLVVYKDGSQLRVHRLIQVLPNHTLQFKADASHQPDAPITQDQVVARVVAIETDQKRTDIAQGIPYLHQRLLGWHGRMKLRTEGFKPKTLSLQAIPSPDQRRMNWAHNTLSLMHAQQTIALLAQAKQEAILLKGPALIIQNIVDPEVRDCGDIDLLIHASQAEAVIQLLKQNGYTVMGSCAELEAKTRFKLALKHPLGTIFDIHWTLVNGGWRYEEVFGLTEEELWHRSREVTSEQGVFRCLSVEHEFLYLCMHLILSGGTGQKWWRDILAYREYWGERLQWSVVIDTAAKWNTKTVSWLVLDRLHHYFGQSTHPWILKQLRPPFIRRYLLRAFFPKPHKDPSRYRARRYAAEMLLLDKLSTRFWLCCRWMKPPKAVRQLKQQRLQVIR